MLRSGEDRLNTHDLFNVLGHFLSTNFQIDQIAENCVPRCAWKAIQGFFSK